MKAVDAHRECLKPLFDLFRFDLLRLPSEQETAVDGKQNGPVFSPMRPLRRRDRFVSRSGGHASAEAETLDSGVPPLTAAALPLE